MTVRACDEDAATALLWEQGTEGIEVQPAEGGALALLAYFREVPLSLDRALHALAGVRIEPAAIPDVDWVARFREGFRPFTVGRFLVAPPWNVPAPSRPDQRVLIVDPGRAFGTGTHETTRLCLLAMDVLANLTAPLLRARAGEIAGLLAPGGTLVLSGLLCEDLESVRDAYACLGPATVRTDGEWAALVAGSLGA